MAGNILRPKKAQQKLGIGRTQFYELRKQDPTFPKFVTLGARARGQFEHELDAWLESKREGVTKPGRPQHGSQFRAAV